MLITIPDVLTTAELGRARAALDSTEWIDGKVTAGYQAQGVKKTCNCPKATRWPSSSVR